MVTRYKPKSALQTTRDDLVERTEQLAVVLAQRDRAISALRQLLTCIDRKSYLKPEQQQAVREAVAVVEET